MLTTIYTNNFCVLIMKMPLISKCCLNMYKLSITIERGKLEKISLEDECEYDNKTVASAIKFYFRSDIFKELVCVTISTL